MFTKDRNKLNPIDAKATRLSPCRWFGRLLCSGLSVTLRILSRRKKFKRQILTTTLSNYSNIVNGPLCHEPQCRPAESDRLTRASASSRAKAVSQGHDGNNGDVLPAQQCPTLYSVLTNAPQIKQQSNESTPPYEHDNFLNSNSGSTAVASGSEPDWYTPGSLSPDTCSFPPNSFDITELIELCLPDTLACLSSTTFDFADNCQPNILSESQRSSRIHRTNPTRLTHTYQSGRATQPSMISNLPSDLSSQTVSGVCGPEQVRLDVNSSVNGSTISTEEILPSRRKLELSAEVQSEDSDVPCNLDNEKNNSETGLQSANDSSTLPTCDTGSDRFGEVIDLVLASSEANSFDLPELTDAFLRFFEKGEVSAELDNYFSKVLQTEGLDSVGSRDSCSVGTGVPSTNSFSSGDLLGSFGEVLNGETAKRLERRRRNNEASRRSRVANKARFHQLMQTVERLQTDKRKLWIWLQEVRLAIKEAKQSLTCSLTNLSKETLRYTHSNTHCSRPLSSKK
ncbi:hypothetical protein P879_01745 [Paragonimus westermani]|uniref:BZIP domain-containing protein n=1 Tax=Paragonimus westermani TaxID=34504 RepID=A0A8T0DIC3_9TREM|nr:hypothetical protein P879_01745 [Paragonimus westermani]